MNTYCILVVIVAVVAAEDVDKPLSDVSTIQESESTGLITWNKYTIIATAAAAVIVVGGIASLMSLFVPLFMYKLCYFFGYCEYSLNSYVDQYLISQDNPRQKRSADYFSPILQTLSAAYEKYGEVFPTEENTKQKRSTEYLGPLIQSLAVAYEKYSDGDVKKNFEPARSSTK